jgi:hypothetical protein
VLMAISDAVTTVREKMRSVDRRGIMRSAKRE